MGRMQRMVKGWSNCGWRWLARHTPHIERRRKHNTNGVTRKITPQKSLSEH
jgi:hypothetical protein